MGYAQLTASLAHSATITPTLSLKSEVSFDVTESQKTNNLDPIFRENGSATAGLNRYGENELLVRALLSWRPEGNHKAAFGLEWGGLSFGDRVHMLGDDPPHPEGVRPVAGAQVGAQEWWVSMISALAEYQYQPGDAWTFWLGGRIDKHDYTESMFSPRVAMVWAPAEKNTYKLIYNRSVRRGDDADLRRAFNAGNQGDTETIDVVEFRYERQQTDRLWMGASFYHDRYNILSWDGAALTTKPLGELELMGAEFELSYLLFDTRLNFSQTFTEQLGFDLREGIARNNISSAPYGYGDDLASFAGEMTKLTLERDLSGQMSVSAAVRGHWGYAGGRAMADFNRDHPTTNRSSNGYPLTDGSNKAFKGNIYLNLGFEYQPTAKWTLRFDGYNLLGLVDEDLNKRTYFLRVDQYRVEAPSLAVTFRYAF